MSDQIFHGAFVFRKQGHGILSSTYFNNSDPKPYPEAAILKEGGVDIDPFIGTFETVWLEENDHYKVKLKIEKIIISTLQNYYKLTWAEDIKSNKPAWEGIGNMEGDLLISCYWGIKNEEEQ